MSEKQPSLESNIERSPNQQEIESMFRELADGRLYKEDRLYEDNDGIYLMEVHLIEQDDPNFTEALLYMRKGTFPKSAALETVIERVYYDSDGVPVGGNTIARYTADGFIRC